MSVSKNPADDMPVGNTRSDPADANGAGYKRPPANAQFKKGKSGNPNGRPQSRRNVANLIKDLFNQSVPVRSGDRTRNMPTCEAMVRVLTNKAGQGDSQALYLVMDILEMTGRTDEITDEEREKRGLRLPRPLTREEFDLVNLPAREKDRQRYFAIAEYDEAVSEPSNDGAPTIESVPPAIKAGDKLAAQGNLDEALAAYRSQLALCKAELTADPNNKIAQHNFRRAIARIGLLADRLLLAGEFARALKFADEAITEAASGFWIAPEEPFGVQCANTGWIHLIRAQARMFLGRVDEARAYFLGFQSNKKYIGTSWEIAILRDFVQMRRMGHSHPLMGEIETHFAATGWVLESTEDIPPRVDPAFARATDTKFADALVNQRKLDEAVIAYRCILAACNTDVVKDRTNRTAQAELNIVTDRVGRLSRPFLLGGNFAEALDCAEEALDREPYSTALNLNRAHALMFLGRLDEARGIYFEYHGKSIGLRFCKAAIIEDFEKLRKAGHSHQLMAEVERRFTAAKWGERLITKAGDGEAGSAIGENGAYGHSVKGRPRSLTPATDRPNALGSKDSVPALTERNDIESGNILASQDNLDGAFAVYKRCIGRCDRTLANGVHNMQAHEDRHLAVNKISDLSLRYLLAGQNEKALTTVDYALSVVPRSPYANVRRAHALMFLGKEHEARELYLQYLQSREQKMTPEQTGAGVILQDFGLMRKFDRVNTLMDEIEPLFGAPKPEVQRRTLIR